MKALKIICICAFFTLGYFYSGAQENLRVINEPNYSKPRLFQDLPEKMNLTLSDLEPLFHLSVGESVTAKFTKGFFIKGIIVSRSGDSASTVKSVVIKSTNRQGAVLTLTKIMGNGGAYTYRGRIISKDNIDAYEIVKDNNQYILQKKNYYEMVRE
jgi:hypothetical protein